MNRRVGIALLVAAAALASVPLFAERFWVQFAAKVMISCIFAASLDLLVGYGGMVSLAHAAFYGLAAYLLAGLSNGAGIVLLPASLPLCLLGVGVVALAIGWLTLRTSGVYFVMVTLAFTEMLFHLFNEAPGLGGSDGLYVAARPIAQRTAVYFAIWASLVTVYLLLDRVVRSPFGRVLVGIRINESRMRTLGFATRHYQLVAFVGAAVIAGLAGYLDATLNGFVNPAQLGWRQSGLVLVTVLLGGKGTLYGPMLGAALITIVEHFAAGATEYWATLIGAIAIATVLFLPAGLAGVLQGTRG
jgi:branched-chain amino acid transport system permease protein